MSNIKLREIFDIPLPTITYLERKSSNSKTVSRSIKVNGHYAPKQISPWKDFDDDCEKVLNIEEYKKIFDRNIEKPIIAFEESSKVKEEKDLYDLFEQAVNLCLKEFLSQLGDSFEVLPEKILPKSTFTPDYTVSRGKNEGFLLPIEVKLEHKFENMIPEIHTLYNEQIVNYKSRNRKKFNKPDIVPLILQTYKYMLHEEFFYGILTTYDSTWVLKFEVDEENLDVEKVFISRRIDKNELVKRLICVLLFVFQDEKRERKFNFMLEGCKRLKV